MTYSLVGGGAKHQLKVYASLMLIKPSHGYKLYKTHNCEITSIKSVALIKPSLELATKAIGS